jgi:hypothetical protein
MNNGLKLHGKNMLKLQEHLPNRSRKEIKNKFRIYKKTLEKQKTSANSELMEILEKEHEKFWKKEEKLLFEKGVKKHGVDFRKIHQMIPTRTVSSIQGRLQDVRKNKLIIDPDVHEIIKRQTKKKESWTKDEKAKFVEALKLHGKYWEKVSLHVFTRSQDQIRKHHFDMMTRLMKESPSFPTELQTILLRLQ